MSSLVQLAVQISPSCQSEIYFEIEVIAPAISFFFEENCSCIFMRKKWRVRNAYDTRLLFFALFETMVVFGSIIAMF